jgi:hypothetical protein
VTGDTFTLKEYLEKEKVSRTSFYEEQRRGEGVEYYKRGAKIYVTDEARLAHRERLARKTREEREKRAALPGAAEQGAA